MCEKSLKKIQKYFSLFKNSVTVTPLNDKTISKIGDDIKDPSRPFMLFFVVFVKRPYFGKSLNRLQTTSWCLIDIYFAKIAVFLSKQEAIIGLFVAFLSCTSFPFCDCFLSLGYLIYICISLLVLFYSRRDIL